MNRPIVYAHRGASGVCPENTMSAFRRAVELGATGIETDVQMSRDGALVICHDEKLDRTTSGKGLLASRTLDELKSLDAGSWFGSSFAGEKIPVLEELLALVAETGIRLNVEIKSGVVLYPGIEAALVESVRRYNLSGQVIFSSFNHYSLVECKKVAPEIPTGILYIEGLVDPWVYAKYVGVNALHPLFHGVRPELVAGAHQAGLLVNTWTVDEPKQIAGMLQCGVDGIITNYPDRVLEVLANA